MDLQAILDAPDSDEESQEARSHSSHVDIERILREDDNDDDLSDAENRNDITITSLSTIETNAHHFISRKSVQAMRFEGMDSSFYEAAHREWYGRSEPEPTSPIGQTSSSTNSLKYNNTGSHNAEEWAVLQQILVEDDEDDDAAWVDASRKGEAESRTGAAPDVDVILQSITSDDDDDVEFEASYVTSMPLPTPQSRSSRGLEEKQASLSTNQQIKQPSPCNSIDTPVMMGSRYTQEDDSNIITGRVDDARPSVVNITSNLLDDRHPFPEIRAGTVSSSLDDEVASRYALEHAMAYEKKLLRPGRREILSPLMVKRRLKPRIELGSAMQKKQRAQHTFKDDAKLTRSLDAAETSRFNFSGVLEHKAMPNLSAQLVKISEEKKGKIGLPTALSINSKFIAVGTQKGVILVFDLFEVLRQKLGLGRIDSPGSEGGVSWTAARLGAVTSIDVSGNGEALIAGYTTGILMLWDVIKGVVLKNIADVHPSPVTSVRFLNEKDMKVVTVDSGGLVNKLTFTKNILWSSYSMDIDCLLDGTAGQILAMNVLPPPAMGKKSSASIIPQNPFIQKLILIALSSERSSFAVAVEPSINVLHRWAKPSQEEVRPSERVTDIPADFTFLPCLAWGWSLVLGGGNVATPILARAWGCKLQFLRASFQSVDNGNDLVDSFHWPAFGLHDEIDSPSPIVALDWLGERSLAFLTVNNEFTVVDTVMMTLQERLNFTGLKLIYAEFTLSRGAVKDFDVDGPKSRSGPLCTTFQNSMRSSDNRMLILCQEEVRTISILGAKRRISALEEDGEWLEALALALDHYENTVKSQEDRQRTQGRDLTKHPEFYSVTRSEDEEWIAKLLMRYFNLAIDNAPESEGVSAAASQCSLTGITRLDLAQSHFQMLAGVCMEFCVTVRRLDLLFGPVFRRFLAVGRASVFLDVLEPYVLNDKLNYIAPEAMTHFIEHCKAANGIAVVERCLLHMDVTVMDFDSIILLLRRNEMYSALFHVFTHGLDDFVTPLEIVIEKVFDAADESYITGARSELILQTQFEKLGYKVILYLQHCFKGRSFPQGSSLQPEEKVHSIRPLLLNFLQKERHCLRGNFKQDLQDRAEFSGARSLKYPYTQVLLMVDARAVLDTFSLALDAPDSEFSHADSGFESIGGWEVEVGAEVSSTRGSRDGMSVSGSSPAGYDRQHIISMLSSILLPDESEEEAHDFYVLRESSAAVNAFLDFLARYLTKGTVRTNKTITSLIISRMAGRYRSVSDPIEKHASQKVILDLLAALPRNAFDPDKALRIIEDAGVHRAALLLHQQGAASWHDAGEHEHRRSGHFIRAINCYLEDQDPAFRTEVFDYARKECSGATVADDSIVIELKDALISKLPDLVNLDAVSSAQLVAEVYIDQLDEIINLVGESDSVAQFMLLHAVISGDLAQVDVVAGSVLSANLSVNHHHRYLMLMAQFHPDLVYDYLSSHDNYRPDECLKLCQQHNIADASAYLLERMGNVSSALQLILQTFEGRMMALKRTVRGLGTSVLSASRGFVLEHKKSDPQMMEQESKQKKEIDGVKHILTVALDLCERNSGGKAIRSEQSSQLWFNVLDRLINAKGFLRLSKENPAHAQIISRVLSDLLQLTMQRMVSSVPLSDLVRKVTSDDSGSRLGDMREMITSLLRTYGHEMEVFSCAVKVMHFDVKQMQANNRASKIEGAPVRRIIGQPLRGETDCGFPMLTETSSFRSNNALEIGEKGNASFRGDSGSSQFRPSSDGLASALQRLGARRKPVLDDQAEKVDHEQKAESFLSLLSASEASYNEGHLSGADLYGERFVGELGEAQSYGSLHWIQTS